MASGGKRTPSPTSQSRYISRSDLRTTQPIQTQTGQPYGQAGQQQAWQRALPLENNNPLAQAMGGQAPGGGAPAAGVGAPPPGQPAPAPGALPGQMGSMFDPTNRPGEPVTHGSASGPGAGPEALQAGIPTDRMSTMLLAVARSSGSNAIATLAQRAQSLGQ